MTAIQPGDLLSATQVAEILGKPVQLLWTWRYRGQGPPSFKVGRELRYRRDELDGWLREQEAATKVAS